MGDDARDGRGGSGSTPGGDLSGRLKRLGAELEARRSVARPASARGASTSDPTAIGRAFRASAEFVAGVVAGGILGWLVDWGLGIKPWGLIVFTMLGFAAGVVNVIRTAGRTAPTGAAAAGEAPPREGA